MYLIYTGSKDTYITNKIIDGAFSASDANVGQAGTIDIFKLYDETSLNGTTKLAEISRGLIKFDLLPLHALTGSSLDINADSFSAKIKMHNLLAGTATPSNFTLVLAPLSRSFTEGSGRDLSAFADLDVANFYTSSMSSGTPVTWHLSGANKGGLLGSDNIDYIVSGTIDGTLQSLSPEQIFIEGVEDLFIDVTTIVSSTLAGNIPDHGFRLAFTGSEENDAKSRFVKRFASMQSSNPLKYPALHITYDDSVSDATNNFVFDSSGSMYLNNFVRGTRTNFVSGTAATDITGANCMLLRLEKNDFKKTYAVSQISEGTDNTSTSGLYSSSFALSLANQTKVNTSNETILNFVNTSGSITFDAIWCSNDETVGFHTGSLEVTRSKSTMSNSSPADFIIKSMSMPSTINIDEKLRILFFVVDKSIERKASKIPHRLASVPLQYVYYQIRDLGSNQIVIPFETANAGTKLSNDTSGLYFDLHANSLQPGYSYTIDLLIKDFDRQRIISNVCQSFKVIK